MASRKDLSSLSLSLLRKLPRLSLSNFGPIEGTYKKYRRGRGQHGGNTHGYGKGGGGGNKVLMAGVVGYEGGTLPFYLRFKREYPYADLKRRRQYPPISLSQLQMMIDLYHLDTTKPIDLAAICNTGHYKFDPLLNHYGIHLTDEGADLFCAKINIEVQWTSEPVIAAIERNGGTICSAFYDKRSLYILRNAKKFFQKGEAIPRRLVPPEDAIMFYTGAATRGYLADPEEVSKERLVLAQKYGYQLPDIEKDPDYDMLTMRKDPRQIFYGLEPGWVVNLKDEVILKPKEERLREYYRS